MFSNELRYRPRMSVLSEDQIDQIHQATLELLERTGVQITHPRAERLREKTKEAMEHQPAPLPNEVLSEMDRMAEHWQ